MTSSGYIHPGEVSWAHLPGDVLALTDIGGCTVY